MTTEAPPLKWSTQLFVTPQAVSPHLTGDKICLPQSALEQLLSAATVTIPSVPPLQAHNLPNYAPNLFSYASNFEPRTPAVERQQHLPHPLTFRIVNPDNGAIVYAGIREFSAEENAVTVSSFLRQSLGIVDETRIAGSEGVPSIDDKTTSDGTNRQEQHQRLNIHAQELPKGTYVRLRPLEAGYDPEDWKSLLERYLRDHFTTLTNGELLTVPNGKDEFRFLVDKVAPEGDGICIIDTDLEVDIEALNEDQARETLKRRLQKSQRAPGTKEGSSPGGILEVGKQETGQVRVGEYVDYSLEDWNKSQSLDIVMSGDDIGEEVDIFVSPMGPKQRARPREEEHTFADISSRPSKRIRIQHKIVEFESVESLRISVHGFVTGASASQINPRGGPRKYRLIVNELGYLDPLDQHRDSSDETKPSPDEIRCKNCHQWVPQRTMMLHENFCLRNNILCPQCNNVFKKSSLEWQNHWHCPHDDFYDNTPSSRTKHDSLFHAPRECSKCDYRAASTPGLAHHSITTCPGKLILCQFCHLQVAQRNPGEPEFSDPEVILSGLTPHELSDGARTTECHLCAKIVRLRDMSTHLRHHDFERLARASPRICRNVNCGRTIDGVTKNGDVKRPGLSRNDLGLCDTCYGPLYVSMYDPEGKAIKRRVERRYLTQLLTGCGKDWCRNEFCKTGRKYLGLETAGHSVGSKEALAMVNPVLSGLVNGQGPLQFCTDEASQKRRVLAEMVAAEGHSGMKGKQKEGSGDGYDLTWCIGALEAEGGDLDRARTWLKDWAPTINEARR